LYFPIFSASKRFARALGSHAQAASLVYRSASLESDVKRFKQSLIAEWLAQALYRAAFEHAGTRGRVSASGNIDYWDISPL
jgi:hypothetical protein